MESLETLHSGPIYTSGQAASLDPFPSAQSQVSFTGTSQGSGTMMLNVPTMPEPLAMISSAAETETVALSRSSSGGDSLTGRSAEYTRAQLLDQGLVYYEDFEGGFQESKVSNFLLQAGYSNTNGNSFKKVGVTEFDNSYAEVDLLTGSAAYGNGFASLELKKDNSRIELAQSNRFNETYFSGEGDHLWVGASIKIDPSYTKDGSSRIIQLKRNTKPGKGTAGPPPFSVFYDPSNGDVQGVISQRLAGETGKSKGFSLGKVEPGKWYDFVIHTYWSSTNKGHTELWLNGKQKIDYTGPNITAFHANDKNTRTSVQIGVYNSGIAKNDSKVHLDEVRIAANDGFYDIVKPGGRLNQLPSSPSSPPRATPESNPTLIGIPENAFRGRYYDSKDFSQLKTARIDKSVNFDWGTGSPVSGIGKDTFSAIWEGDFTFNQGTYEFAATTDDGMQVIVDGKTVIDQMSDQAATLYKRQIDLSKGTHRVEVRYYENGGNALAKVNWKELADQPETPSVLPPAYSTVQMQAESSLVKLNDIAKKGRIISAKDASGGKAYGMFHGNAAATFTFTGESGSYGLSLNAKADLYKGAPTVTVSQNNSKQTWATKISSPSYKLQELNVPILNLKKGDTVTLKYDDDLYGGSGKDRNLYLDYLEFVPQVK